MSHHSKHACMQDGERGGIWRVIGGERGGGGEVRGREERGGPERGYRWGERGWYSNKK